MTICMNCGKSINTISRECPYCHSSITVDSISNMEVINKQKNDYDCKDNKLFLVSVLVPIIGIVFYFIKREKYPIKASSALGGAFVGIIIIAIFISFYLIISLLS